MFVYNRKLEAMEGIKSSVQELPDLPSELVWVAIEDTKKILKDQHYKLDLRKWHAYDKDDGRCTVCFAGAVMSKSLGLSPEMDAIPSSFGDSNARKLSALESFRSGKLYDGCIIMGIDEDKLGYIPRRAFITCIEVDSPGERFDKSAKQFLSDMEMVAAVLELNDL